jgi:hypothetical protein
MGGAEISSTAASAAIVTTSARMFTAEPATSSYAMSADRVIGSIREAERRRTWNR